ncbi:SLAP domain-containing protein [Companilactobacillus ginsenosidimutans]|uniref:S-layer protein C-terminal domain-containing protein n=1 Tax=Companilactobacillus ginsenosidimutans TaxID=1007676 RepID=A0A0H4QM50_9LACO|nr:SLAP domain-containing protein [Companilactobacillus ginsenosidimutans]AKP67788.1 hypothetical protein ABM34_09755 [Companilactobacillus ginsenosidimutans]
MKKTKRFVLTTAIMASLAMGGATTAVSVQNSQAAGIGDTITSIFSGSGLGSTATSGVNVNANGFKVVLPGGTEPTEENIEAAIGGTPSIAGLIPAKTSVSADGKTAIFTADLSGISSNQILTQIGNLIGKVVQVKVPITYSDSLTFKNGTTTANIKKGDKTFKLDGTVDGVYKTSPENATVEVTNDGGFNYAYAGTYSPTVKVSSDGTATSDDIQLTVNVLDASFQNLDQTVIKGANFDPNSVTGTDSIGQTLDMSTESSVNTSKVGKKTVKYTATDPSLDYKGDPIQWEVTGSVNVVDADSTQTINFVDANTGDTVDTTTLTGASGQTKSVDAPSGYDLVNDSDANITLQKGDHTSTVKVVKSGSSVQTPFSGTVSTYSNGGVVPLYNGDGTQTQRSLSANSDWATDQTKTMNGDKYYRVSTNEWVKASQVYEYTPTSSTITTNGDSIKGLYSINGNRSNRSLSPNSAWYTDRTASINGTTMYRVSTDEWVSSADVH